MFAQFGPRRPPPPLQMDQHRARAVQLEAAAFDRPQVQPAVSQRGRRV